MKSLNGLGPTGNIKHVVSRLFRDDGDYSVITPSGGWRRSVSGRDAAVSTSCAKSLVLLNVGGKDETSK